MLPGGNKTEVKAENMTSISVAPPSQFNFAQPANWPHWKKRFERYMSVSGFVNKPDNEKTNMLIYLMGGEAEEILLQLNLTEQEQKYETVLSRFDNYFIPRRNVIFERFKFNTRIQQPGESVDCFITALHSLAEHCNYGELKDELIRDRIVVGIQDMKVSERLQLQKDLTLNDAILTVRQAELQSSQNKILRSECKGYEVAAVKQNNKEQSKHWVKSKPIDGKSVQDRYEKRGNQQNKCYYCGSVKCRDKSRCPARNSSCRSCSKKGHWSIACRNKKVVHTVDYENHGENVDLGRDLDSTETRMQVRKEAQQVSEIDQEYYMGSIYFNNKKQWLIDILVENRHSIPFLVDSGADVSCVSYSSVPKEFRNKILKCSEFLGGPDNSRLKVIGKVELNLYYKGICYRDFVYVIENLKLPILGRPGITKLEVLNFHKNVCVMESVSDISQISSKFNRDVVEKTYKGIFNEIGEFKKELTIHMKPDAEPFVQSVPRVVPLPLLPKLKAELNRLLKLGIIEPVNTPTPWVSPIVCVDKGDTVRLCCDYTKLNENVLRSHFPLPKIEHTLAQLNGSTVYSKLDATSGFYQIKLNKESQLLTTFISPFGRYYFKRLPFGICCAPEYFAMQFSSILSGLEGVVCHMDDVLIYASSFQKHDEILKQVLDRLHAEGITLNKKKCIFGAKSVKYLGHIISEKGISIDPDRVKAIREFPQPNNKTELLRLLGMINFAGKYIGNKSEVLEPLTSLLKKDIDFVWGTSQQNSLNKIKALLEEAPNLSFFDPNKVIIVSADSSCFGLGCCLMQEKPDKSREIVAFSSRLLSEVEKRYAQIEKEALAVTWAAEKFSDYITGVKNVIFETDHKPLLQILKTKNLDDLSPRLQRFRMRLMRYNYTVIYTPGKNLIVPDTLSRAPLKNSTPKDDELMDGEVNKFVHSVIKNLPVKDNFLKEIIDEQSRDPILQKIKQFTLTEWPEKSKLSVELLAFYQYRYDISYAENLLLKSSRIIIPKSLQLKCLNFIHTGHLGITKCRERAKACVWWIGLSTQIDNLVRNCPDCVENRVNIKETFHKDKMPSRPWQKIALDLFKLEKWYLIAVDYYSRYFEIFKLESMNELAIIEKLKEIFSRYGIPEVVRTDNGPQFSSVFKKFSLEYNFVHITSSPYFAQSNGLVERTVQTAKHLLKKNKSDIYLALLAYRTTPLESGFSPAELLMSRKLRTNLPQLPSNLDNIVDSKAYFFKKERETKEKQARNYDSRHRTKDMQTLKIGDSVWVIDIRMYGKIIDICSEPRSYIVETSRGLFRRNRWHLINAPYHFPSKDFVNHTETPITPILDSSNKVELGHDLNRYSDLSNGVKNSCSEHDLVDSSPIVKSDDSVLIEKKTPVEVSSSPSPGRPKRNCKKPSYLSDYHCK